MEKENADAQDRLAGHLHILGIALNFKDDPRLQDTHVLNPHWVTNGIYKILNSEVLAEHRGHLHLSTLAAMLDPVAYPRQKHPFLLDLMKKFELCFAFPDDDGRYLIPELLGKQEPVAASEFDPADSLNFQYHYNVLPEGLLPRFIVRTHALSTNHPRWRTGVVLEFEGCRGVIKADAHERRIFISISGPASSRRRLLAVIRSDFERIHNDVAKLEVREVVPAPGRPDLTVDYRDLIVLERNREAKIKRVVGDSLVELDVSAMLNGVEIARDFQFSATKGAVRLFYSYAHRDESYRDELETHLKLLQRQRLLSTWHDRKITAGASWKAAIDQNIEQADIILLLVSSDFIASDYCWQTEMTAAFQRHEIGKARVIPIIVREVDWTSTPFAALQALPTDGRPVTLWQDRDSAWANVTRGIREAIESMR
jgi:internalin A